MLVTLIESVYNFLWGDLLTLPLGGVTLNLSLMVILESGRAVIVAGGKPARTVRGEHHPVPFVGGELFLDESQHRAEGGGGRCDGLLAEHLEGVGDHFPF